MMVRPDGLVRRCHPSPIVMLAAAPGRRSPCVAASVLPNGLLLESALARTYLSMSLTVERSAPAPASVGMSQRPAGLPDSSWPGARRDCIDGVSVIFVSD